MTNFRKPSDWGYFFSNVREDRLAVANPSHGVPKKTLGESKKMRQNGRDMWAKVAKKHKNWLHTVKSLHLLGVQINVHNFPDHFPMGPNWAEKEYNLAWVGLYNVYRNLVEKGLD